MTQIKIVEVGPRDGLQNEPVSIATEDKLRLIHQLGAAGLQHIEITSFVHPKWIPQLSDAVEVARSLERQPGVHYSALVPNAKGFERAVEAEMKEIAVFLSASETHNRKNINQSIDESIEQYRTVIEQAKAHGMRVRAYISMVFGCPYEGDIAISQVEKLTKKLAQYEVDEISYGDTVGIGNPRQVREVFTALASVYPMDRMAGHFHDTWGLGLTNVHAALEAGVRIFDSAVGGLGGCPYAAGASGNIATEDLVYLMDKLGVSTGVQLEALMEISMEMEQRMGRPLPSKVYQSMKAQRKAASE